MRRVRRARKHLTTKQLGGFGIADGFCNPHDICICSAWSVLVRKHNDPANDYHLPLCDYVVIGHELIEERDIVRISLSLPWMLANALRAIVAEWNFQHCADVTGNVCNRSVDLLEFLATSIPCQNNVLCLSIIPKATESETGYKLTFDDLRLKLRAAVSHLCKARPCSKLDCEYCSAIRELLA
jgi:hypothetical protein